VPEQCGRGHVWRPGLITSSYVHCPGCPVTEEGDGRGHYVWICATDGCQFEVAPPDCPRSS